MNIEDIKENSVYNLSVKGGEVSSVGCFPDHCLKVKVVRHRGDAVDFLVLPGQFNPLMYSESSPSVLYKLGCERHLSAEVSE